MLRKGVCSYEHMYDWEKLNETSLLEKEDFHNHLNMEDIANADHGHTKKFSKDFQRFWNKNFRKIASFVCSRQYVIASWCIWEL